MFGGEGILKFFLFIRSFYLKFFRHERFLPRFFSVLLPLGQSCSDANLHSIDVECFFKIIFIHFDRSSWFYSDKASVLRLISIL